MRVALIVPLPPLQPSPHRGEGVLPSACRRLLPVGEGEETRVAWQWAEWDADGVLPTDRAYLALGVRRRRHG
jgi:hypothetical protein